MARVKIHISELNLDLCPICYSEEVTIVGARRRPGTDEWTLHTICYCCGERSPQTITTELKAELLRPNGILKKRATDARKEIEKDLEQVEKWNMAEWAERFISALYKGHILPEDF